MKRLAILILIIFPFTTSAQTWVYHEMPDSSATWNFKRNVACDPVFGYENTFSITISGDTIINSKTYHKLNKPYFTHISNSSFCASSEVTGYQGSFREETNNKKVYFVPSTISNEYLLYDFNLQVGDTVKGWIESSVAQKDTVISIDSVLVGSSYRKRWNINQEYNISFIEGLGSSYGLTEQSPNGLVGIFSNVNLLCFKENGQSLYPNTSSNCELITAVSSEELTSDQITIFPNPSAGNLTVDLGNTHIRKIQLSDIFGKVIMQKELNGGPNFQLNELNSGIYILKMTDINNRSYNRKIVCNR